MTSTILKVATALLCLVGLNAYRYPDEQILERLYELETMRGGQPLFEDDPRYKLVPDNEEEVHPLVLDDILPYFPEADEYELPEEGQQGPPEIEEEEEQEPDYFRENNLHIRDQGDYLDDPEIRSNDLRDPEQAQQSALWGTHYVSGGAGEGQQVLKPNGEEKNKQEVKTDSQLPAYCEPPNPCPKGYTEKDNCAMGVVDTPAFNRKYILTQQQSGYCACDSEHMKHCPKNQPKINTKPDKQAELQNMLSDNDGKEFGESEQKRLHRVAKKSPLRRFKRFTAERMKNPYLQGEKIRIAAKKSPPGPDETFDKWYHLRQELEGADN